MWRHSWLILLAWSWSIAGPAQDDAVKRDLAQFQGEWQAVAIQQADGAKASADEVQNTSLVVEGDKFTLKGKDLAISGVFSLDPSKTPKAIDARVNNGTVTLLVGIYEIQGDTRKSCFALPGKERPIRFVTESGYFGFEWRRMKK